MAGTMRTRSPWMSALAAGLVACGGGPVEVEARLARITPDAIVFDVQAPPGSHVVFEGGPSTSDPVGSEGHTEVRVETEGSTAHGEAVFSVYRDGWLRRERVGSASVPTPFAFDQLHHLRSRKDGSWVVILPERGRTEASCFSLTGGSLGLGSAPEGALVVAPPGSKVELASDALTIPESGVVAWTPTPASLLGMLDASGRGSGVLTWAVEAPGHPRKEGEAQVALGERCGARLAAHLLASESPLPWTPAEDAVDQVLLLRLEASPQTFRPPGATPLPRGAGVERLAFHAVEREVSRMEGERCRRESGLMEVSPDGTGGTALMEEITPERVTTEITLYRSATGETVGSRVFEPAVDHRCTRVVHPADAPVRQWLTGLLAE